MNFLAKKLGTLTGFSIPYNFLGEPLVVESVWKVYHGTKVEDGAKVTIFEFNLKDNANQRNVPLARNAYKKLKSIRFPGILHIVDFIENDSYLYVISEPVTPLRQILVDAEVSPEVKLFGLYQLAKTMRFVNKDAGFVHGNVGVDQIYVTQQGDWKLSGFEMMTNLTSDPDQPIYRFSQPFAVLQPPEAERGMEGIRKAPVKYDSFRFGCLIYELFNGKAYQLRELASTGKIPATLIPAYKRLVASFSLRSTIEMFYHSGETTFFHTPLIHFDAELTELAYGENEAKLAFLANLSAELAQIPQFPPGFVEYKILPELVKLFNTNTEPANTPLILSHILQFSAGLPPTSPEYATLVKPIIFKAFTLADRVTRLQLLNALPLLVTTLTKADISDRVFPQLISGFGDTNETIREETVKSCTLIAPLLTDRQLNNDLLRLLAKSQMDPIPTIRTNTLVVLASVAPSLTASSRPGVLITAFSKGLKDSFTPCKLHALMAFKNAIDHFPPEICCTRVLGVITNCLLDKNYRVRDEARLVFEQYMVKINDEVAKLPRDPKDDEAFDIQLIDAATKSGAKPVESPGTFMSLMKGSMNNRMVISTPPLDSRTGSTVLLVAPTQEASRLSLDEAVDDGWGFDMEDEIEAPVIKPVPTKTAVVPKTRMKLQPKKANVSKLNLNLDMEDDSGWGDGW
ncbi:hypothetical protein BABINDRAFT_162088 [Babjeviella inositovora NRRL Y-12698]|uniref:Protein kinase domain-containing protein n=1 Tax=Babjeviella inositovora NRRL Y-12698 TaxID=984486 RepID=A0A1E3QPX2_9ASCO|nr:uncharacterized protein BABINDRAFT_162088 [Babjeviella inositovora NRRL Y-12698]ODQ79017.1 hypothetical protein BABINDRAFT_162088 [Babjeviella inositovora NRRL Y-12698]